MEYKMVTIPFDLETAKRIREGKISGRIVTEKGQNRAEIVYEDNLSNCMVGIFERYKDIADGDMEVAMNFIKEAYPFNEETEVFIRKKFNMSIPVEPEE